MKRADMARHDGRNTRTAPAGGYGAPSRHNQHHRGYAVAEERPDRLTRKARRRARRQTRG